MSALLDARQLLLDALGAAGVRSSTTQKLTAPCVHVEPGDPWSELVRMPGRLSRWQLTAIAGRADTEGAIDTLAGFVETVDTALRTVEGAQLPAWAKPTDYLIGGVPYAASVATVSLAY